MEKDVRWKQRCQNFEKACGLLSEALAEGPGALSDLEKEGVIQRFEYSFELAWKCLKDFLEQGGLAISPVTPRQVLKEAFAAKIIEDGQGWIDMLEERNRLAHIYDSILFEKAVGAISARYLPLLRTLQTYLKQREET